MILGSSAVEWTGVYPVVCDSRAQWENLVAATAWAAGDGTATAPSLRLYADGPELSIIMPCLNEADTLALCLSKAHDALRDGGIEGEIIVADNGSTDGSQAIARKFGVRVVDVRTKGYGSALMGGIAAARGRYVIMGDADDSYNFREVPKFIHKLRQGYDLVQGCRLPRGGGTVMPGAMPLLHRWWGNPMFSMLVRWWFHAPVSDVYCGMRGFCRDWHARLNQRCTGMEFATEMIIKSARHGARMAEVPITLHPDGRKAHPPHLRTFRDGWRTLRFFLMYCPRWLFLEPGKLLVLLGVVGFALGLRATKIGPITFGVNTLVFASLAILCGSQAILFALGTKAFGIREGLMPPDERMDRFFRRFTLERGAILATSSLLGGLALLAIAINAWREAHFGHMDLESTMHWIIPGATLTAWGVQTLLSSFFISILGMPRK